MSVSLLFNKPCGVRTVASSTARARSSAVHAVPESRRGVLFGAAALVGGLVSQRSALAFTPAVEVCDPGADGKDCREEIIRKGAEEINSAKSAYGQSTTKFKAASGIATPDDQDEAYAASIFAISEKIQTYISADPFDKTRVTLRKEIGDDGNTWIAKYAKGGSTRNPSARKFYVVIDAMKGWFASNGIAPLPRAKAANVLKDIETTKELLAQGK